MLTLDLGDEDYKSSKFVRVCARVCVEISVVTFHGIGVTIMSFVVVYKKNEFGNDSDNDGVNFSVPIYVTN